MTKNPRKPVDGLMTASLAALALFGLNGIAFAAGNGSSASGQSLQGVMTKPSQYVGKQVTLNGKVERVIDAGSFVMSDPNDSSQRIMVVTANPSAKSGQGKQQAGTEGSKLEDDQKVQVTGRLEMLTVRSEVDRYNPKKDRALFSETITHTPLIVVKPGGIQQQG